MRNFLLLVTIVACCGGAFGQSPPSTCDSTKILSVQNLASGDTVNSLGGLSKISWCDFEFPAPTTPVTSVLVHGQPAFITYKTVMQSSPVTSVILHGYPSFVPHEIVAQLPNSGVPIESVQLQLRRGSSTIASTSIQIQDFSPGIFTLDGTPAGPAIVWDSVMNYILETNPAHSGEAVTVFCEGLGPTNPFVPTGSVPKGLAVTTSTPQVFVGTQLAPVILSRLASGNATPSAAGVYEVTFVVPPVTAGRADLPIYLSIGGKTSNTALLPVAP
jgi:uncharacterized protein (TIGR03437 family)